MTLSGGRPSTPAPWLDSHHFDSGFTSESSSLFQNSSSETYTSKLDPNSKPFSPRLTTEKTGSFKLGRDDDFGLRGLLRNIVESSSDTILSQSDLGFSPSFTRFVPSLVKVMESPFSNGILGVLSDSYNIPSEYRHSGTLAGILPRPSTHYWPTDLLFFLFYVAVGDVLQILAGSLLFDRGWRYNKINKVWLARLPGIPPEERTSTYERGLYQYFDVRNWDRSTGVFILHYTELAEQINPPPELKSVYNCPSMNITRRKENSIHRNPVRMEFSRY